ncbi:ABC transporter permease [Xylocopilactobacillus apis]|uniref:ABC transporter permease n=1 Tax=Xylocopilactobacillus apis TaxID=2932183 RepID=A0AAU9DBQ8_9LACO|nr:ABC transporter permease [Xylocopilactobacillus apis]BDR55606.1 ABC transporter permease [Xylocopilactobacillus apis]
MRIRELFTSALRSLWSNKRRSILTMLGIIIGIAAVITILSLGDGLRIDTLKNLQADSDGKQSSQIQFGSMTDDQSISGFNENDVNKVQENGKVAKVKIQSDDKGMVFGEGTINGQKTNSDLYLVSKPNRKFLVQGRGITKEDLLAENPVALVNESTAKKGYKTVKNALNASIELGGINYTIVGVISNDARKEEYNTYQIVVPRKLYSANVPKNTMKLTFVMGADVAKETDKITEQLNKTGSQHNLGRYNYNNESEFLKQASDSIKAITYFVVAIAGISLFIAGIGVMNMMYISVSERTQEIGIRMAVGATQRQILWQFLIEAVTLTLIGGMVGYLSGLGIARAVSNFMPFKASVTFSTFLLAFGTSTIIGIVFGILPAKTASNKNLIEILR